VIDESAEFIAPLPVVGIRNMVYITPKILLKQSLEVLYLKTSNFLGSISDMNVYLEYNPLKNFGLGVGFNTFNFRFSLRKEIKNAMEFDGSVTTEFSGIMLYAKYFF
jgi:hypothetical protein